MSGLGFIGVLLFGNIMSKITKGISSSIIEILFALIYGLYLLILCWGTGKFIVPKYRKKAVI